MGTRLVSANPVQLPGRIERSTLGDVFGALFRARITGTLELVEPDATTHRVHFSQGLISGIEAGRGSPRLGAILRAMGVLSLEAQTELERRAVSGFDQPLGETLVASKLLPRAALEAALKKQVTTRLESLYAIASARLSFRVQSRNQRNSTVLQAKEFLHDRPRKRRPAARTLSSAVSPGSAAESARADHPRTRAEALAVLGLPLGSNADDVRAAFRRLASELHPDRHGNRSFEERADIIHQFAQASAAYHLLVA